MKSLLLNAIKPIKVKIQTLGHDVYIRELSYKGTIEVASCKNPIDRAVFTMIYGLCDEAGKLQFTVEDFDQIAETLSYAAIQEIAYEVSKITQVQPAKLVK
ncbi:hypothetical protein [Aeromonas veronii]|uniref:hypothetical protein n=1 Tax=Aeromonas veronii TaxID=654 RepID=UPI003D1C1DAD